MKKTPKVNYVDGFVLVVPKKNLAKYKKMANEAKKVWLRHGALGYKECLLDDASPDVTALTFPKLTKAKKNEDIWYSYIEYKNKTHRNQVNKKVMAEINANYKDKKIPAMPFEMSKMAYGGFSVKVRD